MKPKTITTRISLLLFAAAVLAAVLVACGDGTPDKQNATSAEMKIQAATSVNKGPTILWNPTSITDTANPGSRQSFPVTFTSSANLANVAITVVPELSGIVTVSPTSFASIQAGKTATVTVSVAPSSAETLRVVDGTIHVIVDTSTVAKPLPLTLTLVVPAVINGVTVPPEPPADLNNATLAGFDANGNGIRDDVERLLAKEFGANPTKYREAFVFSIAEQAVIVSPGVSTTDNYSNIIACSTMSAGELNKATYALLNTRARSNVYAMTQAGAIGRDCK